MKHGLLALACLSMAAGACQKRDSGDPKGLPPASSWQAPSPTAPNSGAGAAAANPHAANPHAANPHAGMAMGDPHAGIDMGGDPHAGMAMGGDPHAGMAMGDPHAGIDMGGNPHAGMAMGDPHAGVDMGGAGGGVDVMQLGLPPPDPNRPIDLSKSLTGTLKPTAETKANIPIGAMVFFSVKRADPATGKPVGSPLAVKRMFVGSWPMWFELTDADAMVGGTEFSGDVVITAWSDQDQDAMSKSPGDVIGEVRATIPAKDLVLELDTVIQ